MSTKAYYTARAGTAPRIAIAAVPPLSAPACRRTVAVAPRGLPTRTQRMAVPAERGRIRLGVVLLLLRERRALEVALLGSCVRRPTVRRVVRGGQGRQLIGLAQRQRVVAVIVVARALIRGVGHRPAL